MALPKAIRRLTPDRVRDDPRLRALAVGTGVIPPRTMHSAGEAALLADLARGAGASSRSASTRARRRSSSATCSTRGAELHLDRPLRPPARARCARAGRRPSGRRGASSSGRRSAASGPQLHGTSTSARRVAKRWTAAGRPRVHRRRPQRARARDGLGPLAPVRRRGRERAVPRRARLRSPAAGGCPGPTAVVDRLFRGPRALPDWAIADEVDRAVAVRCAPRAA